MNDELREILKHELLCEYNCVNKPKDIIIVVRDQLYYIEACIDSIYANTENFHLYIWDNASSELTSNYLQSLSSRDEVYLHRNETNEGFLIPNNRMAELCQSPYIVLLNSDTEVYEGWDKAMLGYLQSYPEIKEVGYQGGLLDETGRGCGVGFGSDIDYIAGWCACFSKETYDAHGLFDEQNFRFAYFEDADFSLRLKEKKFGVHALHLDYVYHAGGATTLQVKNEMDMTTPFSDNHRYFGERWQEYLVNERVLLHSDKQKLLLK